MTKRVQRKPRPVGRWLTGGIVALMALLLPIAQSSAMAAIEAGDTVYIGAKQGYGGTGVFPIWSETPTDLSNPGEPEAWAYCVEHDVSARTGLTANVAELAGYLGSNYFSDPAIQGKVLWVLAHSYPALSLESFGAAAGVPSLARNDAIEATQYAIWRYTDLNFDANWNFENADSEAAYWYLVNGANANSGLTPEAFSVTAGVAPPSGAQSSGGLVGPFTISTNQAAVSVTVDSAVALTDSGGALVDPNNVHNGDELFLDLRGSTAAGAATIRVSAAGAGSTGKIVSVPGRSGGAPSAENHAQSIVLVMPSTATTSAEATVEWAAIDEITPKIGTSLVDAADQDRVLAWNGGTVVDTISYEDLVPGTEYTVTGELMRKSNGAATGITGSATFTPAVANGTVDVTFVVPEGYAGETLVAFEWVFEGAGASGAAVAEHTDIDDAAQTVVVEAAPTVVTPKIGTSLVDAADQDRVLAWNGGTVVDTISYEDLVPGTEYTVTGELMRKSNGAATGITGSATFTPAVANGTVDVTFVVPEGYAGETLVAFEWVFEGAGASGAAVAEHTDIDDAAQTVGVEAEPKGTNAPTLPARPAEVLATTGSDQAPMSAAAVGVALLSGAALMLMSRSRKQV